MYISLWQFRNRLLLPILRSKQIVVRFIFNGLTFIESPVISRFRFDLKRARTARHFRLYLISVSTGKLDVLVKDHVW